MLVLYSTSKVYTSIHIVRIVCIPLILHAYTKQWCQVETTLPSKTAIPMSPELRIGEREGSKKAAENRSKLVCIY